VIKYCRHTYLTSIIRRVVFKRMAKITRPCLDKAYRCKHAPKRHCGKKFHVCSVKLSTKDNLYLPECPSRRENISNRLSQISLSSQKKENIFLHFIFLEKMWY